MVPTNDQRKSENVNHRRMGSTWVIALMAIVGASCATNATTASHRTTAPAPPATTTATTGVSTTTRAVSVGHAQTTTGPTGQSLTVTAGKPEPIGYSVGGPPGSWVVGFILTDVGPGTFGWVPSAQVTLIDSSGRVNSPQVETAATTATGKPAIVAVGQQLRALLIFVLAPGAHPKTASFSPFGTSVAPTQWSA
jgi:hypothetical protein